MSPRVAKSGIPNFQNRHINEEFRRPGNNSISEFQISGVGRVKTLHHQESRNRDMRNAEILEEGGQFRVPRVGRVKTLHHQESRNREMRNAEISEGGQFRVSGVGRVNTLHHQESRNYEMRNAEISEEGGRFRIPGVGDVKNSYYRSPEVAKCEIVKCQRLHTGGSDIESWKSQVTRLFIARIMKG
jgi:hypothetical protein